MERLKAQRRRHSPAVDIARGAQSRPQNGSLRCSPVCGSSLAQSWQVRCSMWARSASLQPPGSGIRRRQVRFEVSRNLLFDDRMAWNQFYDADGARRFEKLERKPSASEPAETSALAAPRAPEQ